jgi:5-methylcytosine-specific restriction endonuclease McrA
LDLPPRKGLRTKVPLKSKTRLGSRSRIKPRSVKMEEVYVERRSIVSRLLSERSCERCGDAGHDVHEKVSRGRGGSIVEITNLVVLCRTCHRFVTDNPIQAESEGWLVATL